MVVCKEVMGIFPVLDFCPPPPSPHFGLFSIVAPGPPPANLATVLGLPASKSQILGVLHYIRNKCMSNFFQMEDQADLTAKELLDFVELSDWLDLGWQRKTYKMVNIKTSFIK